MPIKFIAIIIFAILITACSEKDTQESTTGTNETKQNQTPKILNGQKGYELSSYSKRKKYDIITALYNEAMEKNTELNDLNEEINKMYEFQNDSLKEYSKYTNTNNQYWVSAQNLIRQIEDSLLRKSTSVSFELIEKDYKSTLSSYEQKLDSINARTLSLNDQHKLMKLFVTAPMIKNYQRNELPNIQTLENIIKKYDQLIKESENFIK